MHSRVYVAAIIYSRLNRLTRCVLSVLSTPHINFTIQIIVLVYGRIVSYLQWFRISFFYSSLRLRRYFTIK